MDTLKKNSLLLLFLLILCGLFLDIGISWLTNLQCRLSNFKVFILCGHFIIVILVTYFMRAPTILPRYRNFLAVKPAMKTFKLLSVYFMWTLTSFLVYLLLILCGLLMYMYFLAIGISWLTNLQRTFKVLSIYFMWTLHC